MECSIDFSSSENICYSTNESDKVQINNKGNIPISHEISEKIQKYKSPNSKHITFNSIDFPNKLNNLTEKIQKQCHMNKILKSFYPKNTIKSESDSSYTTEFIYDTQKEYKIKTVTFSTVEIVRVESYKKYNAANTISKLTIQKNIEQGRKEQQKSSLCNIF